VAAERNAMIGAALKVLPADRLQLVRSLVAHLQRIAAQVGGYSLHACPAIFVGKPCTVRL
jgi:hypothetical protein